MSVIPQRHVPRHTRSKIVNSTVALTRPMMTTAKNIYPQLSRVNKFRPCDIYHERDKNFPSYSSDVVRCSSGQIFIPENKQKVGLLDNNSNI